MKIEFQTPLEYNVWMYERVCTYVGDAHADEMMRNAQNCFGCC